jgi:uncharacterized protein YjcR
MLTVKEAVEIYKMKISLQNQIRHRLTRADFLSLWGKTSPVAKMFGVKPRTVKYIWNRHTWAHATKHLWASESGLEETSKSLVICQVEISSSNPLF